MKSNYSVATKFLTKGTIGTLSLKIFSTIIGFSTSIIIARLLGVEEYGNYAYAISWIYLLSIPSIFGMDKLLVRNISFYFKNSSWTLMKGMINKSIQIVLLTSIFIVLFVVFIINIFQNKLSPNMYFPILFGLLSLPLINLIKLRQSLMQGMQRVTSSLIPECAIKPLVFIFLVSLSTFPLINISSNVNIIMLFFFSSYLIALLISELMTRNITSSLFINIKPLYETKKWIKSAIPLLIVGSFHIINAKTDIIMLGSIDESRSVGIYHAATRGGLLVSFFLISINTAIAPMIARYYISNKNSKLQKVITKSAQIIFIPTVIATLIMIIFGEYFLSLFGKSFVEGKIALIILCIGQLINAASGSVTYLLNMTENEKWAAKAVGISAVLNILLNALLIPKIGINGAAIATTLSMIVWNILMIYWVYKYVGIHSTILGNLVKFKKE